jgi:PST family polysaccharide transporter
VSLSALAARGAAVTIGLQAARFMIQFAGLVLLGRLLAPDDFGLVAMVTAVIGIGDIIREFGLVPATVQAASLSQAQRSNLFWLGAGLGILVAVAVCSSSQLLALIYHDDRVTDVALVLSLTFVFSGLQSQFQAGLARDMRFAAMSVSDLAAQFVGLGTAVVAAILGWGYWALVAQLVVQSFSLLVFRVSVAKWLPSRPRLKTSVRPQIVYGRSLVLTQILVYVSSNIDSFLIGSKFGSTPLGFYNRGFQILMMPLNQILTPLTTVALPVLSKIKDDTDRFNKYIQRGQIIVAYPTVFLFCILSAAADPLIRLIFGAQWLPSASIFQILSIAGAFQSIGYISYWVFLSKGLTSSHFRFSLISRTILIASIIVGSVWGPPGIAAGYSLGALLSWPLALIWLRRVASIEVRPLIWGGLRAAILGLICCIAGFGVRSLLDNNIDVLTILLVLAAGMAAAGVLIMVVPAYRGDFAAIMATVRLVVSPRKRILQGAKDGTK